MRSYILFVLAALISGLMAKDLQVVFGSLVYSDDGLGSLVYKSSAGDVFEVFDEGLTLITMADMALEIYRLINPFQ